MYKMSKKDHIMLKRLNELIRWYNPNTRKVSAISVDLLSDLKTLIENSDCVTCSENESESEEVITKYPPKIWICDVCNKTYTNKYKTLHLRSKMHNKIMKKAQNQ